MNHKKSCDYCRLGIACDCDNAIQLSRPVTPHDELLAIIDDNFSQCGDDCESCRRDNASWFALHEVVELHKPEGDRQQQCEHDKKTYPCPTIQAIEKELG